MTKKLGVLTVALSLGLAVAASAKLEVTKCVPADTFFIAKLNLAEALKSPVVTGLVSQHAEQYNVAKDFLTQNVGLSLEEIQTLWILSSKPNTATVVAQGKFDPVAIQHRFGTLPNVTEVHRDGCTYVARFEDQKKGTTNLGAILDGETIVFGEEACVSHFLDTFDGTGKAMPATDARLAKLLESKSAITAAVVGDLMSWPNVDKNIAATISAAWFTCDLTTDLAAVLSLTALTPDKANGLEFLLRGLIAIQTSDNQPTNKPVLQRLLKSTTVTRDGTSILLTARVTGADVQQLVPASQPPAAPPPPAAPAKAQ